MLQDTATEQCDNSHLGRTRLRVALENCGMILITLFITTRVGSTMVALNLWIPS